MKLGNSRLVAGTPPLSEDQLAEISKLRSTRASTLRPTSEGLERLMYSPIPVLDHGFIRVVDYMGDDAAIVQAARVSYGRGTKRSSDDAALIAYLMRHSHTTPFEMAAIKLHVKLPIFVARQWIRHRTASVNEYSARYSILDKEFYIPSPENLGAQTSSNRQGRSNTLDPVEAQWALEVLRRDAELVYRDYEELLNQRSDGSTIDPERSGLARELARMNLSLNFYTQWYWKIDLHNLMHFLKLRTDPHAQYEIRAYAMALVEVLEEWVPLTYQAFREYRLSSAQLSGSALDVVRAKLRGEVVTQESSGLSAREWRELQTLLGFGDSGTSSNG